MHGDRKHRVNRDVLRGSHCQWHHCTWCCAPDFPDIERRNWLAIFPNWNRGIGSYAFWAAEAGGLSLTFGAYPILLIAVHFFPQYSDLNKDGSLDEGEKELFALFPEIKEAEDLLEEQNAAGN